MISGGVAFEVVLFSLPLQELGLLFFHGLGYCQGRHHGAGIAFSSVLYTIRETQEELGSAIVAYKIETAHIMRKGIRKLHHPSIDLLPAIPVVATFALDAHSLDVGQG